ncbi:single-stranded DNA-binding protein [Candidatus Uhrbacteria bacterium]|nr:single-stranded DNA-binding protein [Candidatus Uhrbacteria bacterium]
MNLNKAMLIGNLTRDPEVRSTPTGQTVCSFGLATNRVWKDKDGQKQEQVEFHNLVAWGKLAEICGQYLKKGKKVYVEGRLQTRKWQAQDGTEKQRTEIVMEGMQMLDRASSGGNTSGVSSPASAPAAAQAAPGNVGDTGDEGIKIEEIPF